MDDPLPNTTTGIGVPPSGGEANILANIMTDPPTVDTVLSFDESSGLSDEIRSKLNDKFAELSSNTQKVLGIRVKERVVHDQHVFDLDSQLKDFLATNDALKIQITDERNNVEDYLQKYRTSVATCTGLEEKSRGQVCEISNLKSSLDSITRERDELSSLTEKRNVEIGKLTNDLSKLSEQLQSTTVAKLEALSKIDGLVSKEIELGYKTKQFESEREWLTGQIKLLNEELDKKSAEILGVQRDSSCRYLHLQTDLSEKIEELRIAEMTMTNLKKSNEEQQNHVESLMKKLQDSQDIEGKMEENYRQELKSQRKVAELYRESSEESSKKLEELEDAVSNLQDLLKTGTDRYGELETRFHSSSKQFQDEISSRDEEIVKLKGELVQANEIMDSIQKHGMTDEMIQSLSPAAAAASSLLKGSQSITEIFSKYQEVWQELSGVKCENMKLNGYIREILQDIESRAPVLKKQRDEYERGLETIDILSSQLDVTMLENSKAKSEIVSLKKNFGVLGRENERLKGQMGDLARQVKCLLTEVERGNNVVPDIDDQLVQVGDEGGAQNVISRTLVTFKNVDELQQQNVRLLAVVRELSEAQEKNDRELQDKSVMEIRDSFAAAKKELEELRELRLRQEDQLQSVVAQRDTFSNLLKQRQTQPSSLNSDKELESKYDRLMADYKKLKEDTDMYKTEKRENDRIMTDQMDKLRDDVMKMRGENAKLVSQVEYNNERAKVYGANLESYKKTINVVEERNRQYVVTCLKHEQSIDSLKNELGQANSKLARVEVNLASVIEERNGLVGAKARLMGEKEILLREKGTRAGIDESLAEIKKSLEVSGESTRVKLEQEVEALKSENSILRRKIESESLKFRESLAGWDSREAEYRERAKILEVELYDFKIKYEDCTVLIDRLKLEIEGLKEQLVSQKETNVLADKEKKTVENEEPTTSMENKIEVIGLRSEVESLRGQLEITRSNTEEYRKLSSSLEEQLNMLNESNKSVNREITDRLACKDDIIREIQLKLDGVDKEFFGYKISKEGEVEELRVKLEGEQEEGVKLSRELREIQLKMDGKESELTKIRQDLEDQNGLIIEIRDKYERELHNHADDSRLIGTLRGEVETLKSDVENLNRLRKREMDGLEGERLLWKKTEEGLIGDARVFKSEAEELRGLNVSLQDQVIKLAQELGDRNRGRDEGDDGPEIEGTGRGDDDGRSSSEQWLQLIRYLRREKELSKSKMEIAQATSERLESQLKQMEAQYEEVKRQLSELNNQSHVSIITSAKQAELLRKVETLSALTDSNRILREEKESALTDLASLKEKLDTAVISLAPLEKRLSELESSNESLSNENEVLKNDISRWRSRATALIEKTNKVNPEEMKRLQNENEAVLKQFQSSQENVKKQQQEINRQGQHLKMIQNQLAALQTSNQAFQTEKVKSSEDLKKWMDESTKLSGEVARLRQEVGGAKKDSGGKAEEIEKMNANVIRLEQSLEDHKNTVKQVKNIARKYKKQYEDLLKETEDLKNQPVEDSSSSTKVLDEKSEECDNLKKEVDVLKVSIAQNDERSKLAMKNLRDKLTQANQLRSEVEGELNELKGKVLGLEGAVEEGLTRFNALKSQYEVKIRMLESKKDEDSNLQLENENLTRELEMLRQRLSLLEKQFKVVSKKTPEEIIPQQQQVVQVQQQQPIIQQQLNAPCTSSSTMIIRPPLTASIRPMSQDIKQKLKSVVSVQAMVNQQQQQQSQSQTQQQGQQQQGILQVPPTILGVAPVSQAQVSTSTPDNNNYQQQQQQFSGGSSRPGIVVVQPVVDCSSTSLVVPPQQHHQDSNNVVVLGTGQQIHQQEELQQQGQLVVDNSLVMDLVSSSVSQHPQLTAEVPSCSSMGSNNKRTRSGQRVDQQQQEQQQLEEDQQGEVETSLTMDEEEEEDSEMSNKKKRRTEEEEEQLVEEGQNREAEALGQTEEENEADQMKQSVIEEDDDDDVIVIGSGDEDEDEEDEEEEEEDDDVLEERREDEDDNNEDGDDDEGMLVEDDDNEQQQPGNEEANREADSLEHGNDEDEEVQLQQEQPHQENPDTSVGNNNVRMAHNPRPVTLPGASSSSTSTILRRNYPGEDLLEDEGIVPSTPTLFIPRRNNDDGFAEAINSPLLAVPSVHLTSSSSRFTFASNTASSGGNTIDETRVVDNFLMVDDNNGTGRSVPSTPMMVLSPQGGVAVPQGTAVPVVAAISTVIGGTDTGGSSGMITEQQPSSSSIQQGHELHEIHHQGEDDDEGQEEEDELEEGEEPDEDFGEYDGTEVPTSSGDQDRQHQDQQQPQQSNHRVRPTPIVWDQPTSSTSSLPSSASVSAGGRQIGRGGLISRGLTRGLPRGLPGTRGGGTYNRQLINQPYYNPTTTTTIAGGPSGIPPSSSRGLQQSARRSRPHYYPGGVVSSRGGGTSPPSTTTTNPAPRGKGNFTKPY